jgi:hypothetical protein
MEGDVLNNFPSNSFEANAGRGWLAVTMHPSLSQTLWLSEASRNDHVHYGDYVIVVIAAGWRACNGMSGTEDFFLEKPAHERVVYDVDVSQFSSLRLVARKL